MIALLTALLLAQGEIVWPPHSPQLPIFGSGPVFNVFQGNELANMNASAHIAWGVALTSTSLTLWGREGMWLTVGANAGVTLIHESCFHNGDPSEVRTDLTSRIGSTLLTAGLYELLHALHVIKWPGE